MTQELWGVTDIAKYRGVTPASISQYLKRNDVPPADFKKPSGQSLWFPETIKPWLKTLPPVKQRSPRRKILFTFYTDEGHFALYDAHGGYYEVYKCTPDDEPYKRGSKVTRFYCPSRDLNGEVWDTAISEISRILGPETKRRRAAWEFAREEADKLQKNNPELKNASFVYSHPEDREGKHVYDINVEFKGNEISFLTRKRKAQKNNEA